MTDETTKPGMGDGGIEFNPPVHEIYGDAKTPIPQEGDRIAPDTYTGPTAEDVGLALKPGTQPARSTFSDFKQLLQKVRLPERRRDAPLAVVEQLSPSAPPLGPAAPSFSPTSEETPSPEAEPTTATDRSPVVSLHTMKDDVQDAVREQQISMVRAASLEAQKRARAAPPPPIIQKHEAAAPKSHRSILPVLMIVIFVALGGAALYGAYFLTSKQNIPVPPATGIIFAEQQSALSINGEGAGVLKQALSNILSSQGNGGGSIMQVIPTVSGTSGEGPRKASLEEFLHTLGARPPDELVRALNSDFFLGIHAADVPSTVFIIPVTSYDHAFAGMLAWEEKIDADLQPLFKQISSYLPPTSTTSLPARRTFQDYMIRNYDTRILRDDDGSVILYYSFTPQQNFLIIASSPYSFPEVLSRLQAQRKL